jgi:cholesterol oxidase
MMKTHVITASVPALGLRVDAQGDAVTIGINDLGGRGQPWAAVLVPVEQDGAHLRVWTGGEGAPPRDKADYLGKVVDLKRLARQDPPYIVVSRRSEWDARHGPRPWPFHANLVLVLMLYVQSPDIGEQPFGLSTDIDESGHWSQVTAAVHECLAGSSLDALRGGLITGPTMAASPPASNPGSGSPSALTFSLASCQYQSDFLDRMPDDATVDGPADASLLALGRLLNKPGGPSLMLFVGDQVYVDATAGLFDAKAQDGQYRLPYERQGESRGSKAALQSLRVKVHMMPDDHEIIDNWEPGEPPPPPGGSTTLALGTAAYWKYQRLTPPKPQIWHAMEHCGLPFFLADARTERKGRNADNWAMQTIMSETQFSALCKWMTIDKHKTLPKFVSTASALFPRSLAVARDPACALHSDTWDGYPKSMHDLLAHACDNQVTGLVFLSGDEHISNWVEVSVSNLDTGKSCKLHSVHSSALYAPYPFANAMPEDFARCETFLFPDRLEGRYRCQVRTVFAPQGDGFALLTAMRVGSGWDLAVAFHNAAGPKPGMPVLLRGIA